jgi:hypothetical protein
MSKEAARLDDAFLAGVHAWTHGESGGFADEATFDRHARALFAYQFERNAPYARFAASRGFDAAHLPASWREIPAVPASAFKDATLATFDASLAELTFHTSGTTSPLSGKQYMERAALYDAALLAGFDRFMLADRTRLRFLNLVPDPRLKKHSSLGYMMGYVSVLRGDGKAAWFLEDDGIRIDDFIAAMRKAVAEEQAVCIAGTAFAFVALLDLLQERNLAFSAPPSSRIMETGGFKGRTRAITREALYTSLTERLGIPEENIVAEYGMTELTSQYYDTPVSRGRDVRMKAGPPWLRTLVVDTEGYELPPGEAGFLRHIDLGNRSSVLAVQTEDRGYALEDAIVLLGRTADAPPRGCSLDADDMTTKKNFTAT